MVRLDLDHTSRGWKVYSINKKLMKIPRHFLDRETRLQFDLDHPDYEEGQQIEESKAENYSGPDRQWFERSAATKALNKTYMGALHLPQKTSTFKRPEVDAN